MSQPNHTQPPVLQTPLAKACLEVPPSSRQGMGHNPQGADCWFPHKRKNPSCSEPQEVHLESGTPLLPCCPDLRPGGSDSTFRPSSLADSVRRPPPVTSLTHTSSWLYPSCDPIGLVNCSLRWPRLHLLPPHPVGKGSLAIYLDNSGRPKKLLP